MMKLSGIVMVAACLGIVSIAQATPTATYTLVIGQEDGGATGVPGQWTLYVADSVGDNLGIAYMRVGICAHINQPTSSADLQISNDMPQTSYSDSSGTATPNPANAGFTELRVAAADHYTGSGGLSPLVGVMDTSNSAGFYVVTGLGQQAGSFPAVASVIDALGDPYNGQGTTTQATWSAHLKIAHGTYNTTTLPNGPVIDPSVGQTVVGVLLAVTTRNGMSTDTATTFGATLVTSVVVNTLAVPEPSSLAIAGFGVLGLLARRRRNCGL